MDHVDDEKLIRDVTRGFRRALILWLLERKPASGYFVTKEMKRITGQNQSVGGIYSLLYEFEERGLITGEWTQRGKRKIKNYTITDLGRTMLENIKEMLEMPVRDVLIDLLMDENK